MAEDLFSHTLQRRFDEFAPLAARMRPRTLDEFVGQRHIVGPGSSLRTLIETDNLTSIILWGPPGTGKTSLANVIALATKTRFVELSAVNAGVAEVRKIITEAKDLLASTGRRTTLFIDEIHRFNKGQQDALLPAVENRWVVLVGATTENPFFEVNSPLMSRSHLYRLEALAPEDVRTLLTRALSDDRGLGDAHPSVDDDAIQHIIDTSGGDARAALNGLEVAVAAAGAAEGGRVTRGIAEEALQRRQIRYDKSGDQHYDVVSAFIKSMRGSDPDAALFWLARMLEAGEDARFIVRRIVIFASEDVGNADPMALVVAVSAAQALEFVGLPEAALNLAQAVTYLASAPKSNASTVALGRATKDLAASGNVGVPSHLRDASYPGAAKLGHGKGYKYPHDFPSARVDQQYLPDGDWNIPYYEPTERGEEKAIGERLNSRRGGPGG